MSNRKRPARTKEDRRDADEITPSSPDFANATVVRKML
jgi:hypothetical protein